MEYDRLIGNNSRNRGTNLKRFLLVILCVLCILCVVLLILNIFYLQSDGESDKNVTQTNMRPKFTILPESVEAPKIRPLRGCKPRNLPTSYESVPPDAFDWRDKGVVTEVIDQLRCEACWAISIVGVMECMLGIDQLAKGTFRGPTRLSVQELIDCSYRDTCSLGDPSLALYYLMEHNMSIITEKEYPLTLRKDTCKIPKDSHPKGVQVKDYKVECDVTADRIMSLVYNHGPVVVAVNSIPWVSYTDGTITRHCNGSRSNHVAQIVGYNTLEYVPYYIVKNSWGVDFGEDGYVKVEMGKNICNIEQYVTYIDIQTN